jgi:hypothetical protein
VLQLVPLDGPHDRTSPATLSNNDRARLLASFPRHPRQPGHSQPDLDAGDPIWLATVQSPSDLLSFRRVGMPLDIVVVPSARRPKLLFARSALERRHCCQ